MSIPLAKPDIGEREISYVTEVLRSGDLSLGPRVPEFEERFASLVGTRYAVAVNSGTSALHLCIRALGIGSDDEVITTSFSFVASTNCILYERALPVFLDIDSRTLNLNPAQVEQFLALNCERRSEGTFDKHTGRRVKAILPVHVFGLPCEMDEITRLADEYGLQIIEDACEALGASFQGRSVGTFGNVATFAFYPNKQLTTAEGGMIVTDDARIRSACQAMRNQGRDAASEWLRHDRLGFNYRLSDLHSALGVAQLERWDEIQSRRATVARWYEEALSQIPWIHLPFTDELVRRSWFVFSVQLREGLPLGLRDRLIGALRQAGVSCQAYFPAIHQQPYLGSADRHIPFPLRCTESAAARCIALPFYGGLRLDQVKFVCATLGQVLQTELDTVPLAEEQTAP